MRPALRLALLLAVVFALGAASGLLVARLYVERTLRSFLDGPAEQLADRPTLWFLQHRAGLSAAQLVRAQAILTSHRDERRALQRTCVPQLMALRDREVDELLPILDEKQRAEVGPLFEQIQSRLRGWSDTAPPVKP